MYGHYRISIDLNESIAEIRQILSAVSGETYNDEMTTRACAHYKQLALVCACAFMMSPISLNLKDRQKRLQVRNSMSENIQSVYPMFVGEVKTWDYQETITVVTELAISFVQTIIFFKPELLSVIGLPHMYVFTPLNIGMDDAPETSKFDCMRPLERYRELRKLDTLSADKDVAVREPDNRLTFTLWVRPAPTARLLT
jgi:hypothetical protein